MRKEIVKEWIYKAEEDYESAVSLVRKRKKPVPDSVCFHAQQCVEKYLKAFLVFHDIEPPVIHDLQVLKNLCSGINKDFNSLTPWLDILNAYAVDFRYPGEKASVEEARNAVSIMKKVREFVWRKLEVSMGKRALVITVGAQAEQIIFSLKNLNPEYVGAIYTDTKESKNALDRITSVYPLKPSKLKHEVVADDSREIDKVVEKFYSIYGWLKREGIEDKEILVDPTGGRKWMSAAVTMIASFLGLDMIYVYAKFRDNRPDPSTMKLIPLGNAYELVGFLEEDKGDSFFNEYNFEGALKIYQILKEKVEDPRRLEIKEYLAEGYLKWDLFQFKRAYEKLDKALNKIIQYKNLQEKKTCVEKHVEILKVLKQNESNISFSNLLKDETFAKYSLLTTFSYAKRCQEIKKWDWGVIGLYRTLELISQLRLAKKGIDFNKIPPNVKQNYDYQFRRISKDILGAESEIPDRVSLMNGWILLYTLQDEIFKQKKTYQFLKGLRKNTEPRNSLWLVHKNRPATESDYNQLQKYVEMWLVQIIPDYQNELKNFEFIKF